MAKKRVSKKNKKSWRKNVDVADVEDFLEDQRLEERLGCNLATSKSSDLFDIDTAGDSENTKPGATTPKITVKRSLRLREPEIPKCYALLERRSAVPDPVVKRNPIKQRVKTKEPTSTFKKRKPQTPRLKLRAIWDEVDRTKELGGLATWMTPDTVRHTLQNTGFKRKQRPTDLKTKPSPLAAIEAPHPGMSYNPSLEDHQQLLHAVASTEAEIEKKEKHIFRTTTKMFRKVPPQQAEKEYLEEMSSCLNNNNSSGSESDSGEYKPVNLPVVRKKKTLQKRRKLKEEREKRKMLAAKKLEKKKRSDVNERLQVIKKSIEKKEAKSSEYLKKKEIRKEQEKTKTKLLGKTRFEAAPLEFQSPKELAGNLRQLKPEGSVLSDRFLSLQKRNVVEPTLKRNIRRAKVKRFIKSAHKMEWDPKGY